MRRFTKFAGRPGLSLIDDPKYPKYLEGYSENFPKRINVSGLDKGRLEEYSREIKQTLDDSLLEYGAVLFRGLPIETPSEFSTF